MENNENERLGSDIVSIDSILPEELFVIPLKSRPIFPGILTPLIISQGRFSEIVEKNVNLESFVALLLMRDDDLEDVQKVDLYSYGTIAKVFKKINLPDGGINILINCLKRIKVTKFISDAPKIMARVEYLQDDFSRKDIEIKALTRAILSQLKVLSENNPLFTEEMKLTMVNVDDPGRIADFVASILNLEKKDYQFLLETVDVKKRLDRVLKLLDKEIQIVEVQKKIQNQINEKVEQQQRTYFLQEQLKAIRKELGMDDKEKSSDIKKLNEKLANLKLTVEAMEKVEEELEKLEYLEPQAGDYGVIRNYLELIASLPWGVSTKDNENISQAEAVLEKDHYGLDDVKKRILEFLAVRILKKDAQGSIICLVGPPGVGKTSLGRSMAEALNRKFYRITLGGMRDEAEIKGHRRTYVGAMPGKIIQGLKIVGSDNPIILLDEIDKIGVSYQGDPASALLEVLDPEQNSSFRDNFLDLAFDISKVLFITTANTLDSIPPVLLDRMEVIRIAGYLDNEKYQILKKYILPKQLKKHGLLATDLKINKQVADYIITRYAREAGLRNLERNIEKICRRRAYNKVHQDKVVAEVKVNQIKDFLGPERFNDDAIYNNNRPGEVNGLAWTAYGGSTLTIESKALPDKKGSLLLTGQLGDVMKESANIAYSYAKGIMALVEEKSVFFDENIIHLHIPAGATPKDGPSAGITMALSILSLAFKKSISTSLAMTGELTLSGRVLPIGGLKEKILAARRNKIKAVIFPKENEKDLEEIPDNIKGKIRFHAIQDFVDLLAIAMPWLYQKLPENEQSVSRQ